MCPLAYQRAGPLYIQVGSFWLLEKARLPFIEHSGEVPLAREVPVSLETNFQSVIESFELSKFSCPIEYPFSALGSGGSGCEQESPAVEAEWP